MAIDPATISAGVGLLTSVFGSKPQTPGYVKRNYELQNALMKRATDLYDGTDYEAIDQQALNAYSQDALASAMNLLSGYDARAAALGSPLWKGDTQKTRARGQIASNVGRGIGQMQANLISSRPQRQAALLPSSAGAAGAFPAAAYLDQQIGAQNASQVQRVMDAARLIGAIFQKGKANGGERRPWDEKLPGTTTNDRYFGIDFSSPVTALGFGN